jgi:hypothetical protein
MDDGAFCGHALAPAQTLLIRVDSRERQSPVPALLSDVAVERKTA